MEKGLTFDDISLVPQHTDVESRSKDCLTAVTKWGIQFDHPLIPANMDTVFEKDMMDVVYRLNGLGFLHRFMPITKQASIIRELIVEYSKEDAVPAYVPLTIGVKTSCEHVEMMINNGASIVLLDVAHADSVHVINALNWIKKTFDIPVIVGNIATRDAALRLIDAEADGVKVGIGSGSICSTRLVTGFGVPQVSALMDVAGAAMDREVFASEKFAIISDGGIKHYGDIAKAIAVGADFVMSGRLFAGCMEAPGERIGGEKIYRGMASFPAQLDNGSLQSRWQIPEGVAVRVPVSRSADSIIREAKSALQSSMSYNGVKELRNFCAQAEMVVVTESSRAEGSTL